MTKDEINTCFDRMNEQNKALIKWTPIVGLVLVAIGGIMYLALGSGNAKSIGLAIAGMGAVALLLLAPIMYFAGMSTKKKVEEVRTILATEPKKLIWAYVYQIVQNGVKNEFIVMNFRDGQKLEVHKSAIKEYTLEDFLYSLKSLYNEQITLGFSEELKQKYLNGQL